jgi:hypothetical protein
MIVNKLRVLVRVRIPSPTPLAEERIVLAFVMKA